MAILPEASPYPVTHSGGIKAVAIATPGKVTEISFLAIDIIPAMPPKIATNISKKVGRVLDCISAVISGISNMAK